MGTLLGDNGVNIAQMQLGRSAPNQDAVAVLALEMGLADRPELAEISHAFRWWSEQPNAMCSFHTLRWLPGRDRTRASKFGDRSRHPMKAEG